MDGKWLCAQRKTPAQCCEHRGSDAMIKRVEMMPDEGAGDDELKVIATEIEALCEEVA